MDNLVAHNTTRVLKAFQNARVGSHVSSSRDYNKVLFFVFFYVIYLCTILSAYRCLLSALKQLLKLRTCGI